MQRHWQTPVTFLVLASIAMPLGFSAWSALLNNFAIEKAAFTGVEIGILQSLREIPGFLAFTTVFVLLLLKEQTFAVMALAIFGLGIALTGFFPSEYGLYFSAVLMSIGFHYMETIKQSLSLQWLSLEEAPRILGRLISVGSLTSLVAYGVLWVLLDVAELDYVWIYLLAGTLAVALAVVLWRGFPHFESKTIQRKNLVLRRRYWLYYGLTFFSGARRQIFVVFAGFLMVEKFGYSASNIAALFLVNHLFNWLFAERIGALIGRVGEKYALTFEYTGLIFVFTAYAFVDNGNVAAGLYVIDHMFFALAIAIKTYFQKIADPADIASTAGVSFTINHIAAVIIPAVFGIIWITSPSLVFLIGAAIAACSLILSQNVPSIPSRGNEVVLGRVA
ncbi:MAG TPA: MFS transporter [Pseudomonadales bacterium]|nr:MFS transporter [Gammaproteobacteria bacterium]HIM35981.1 MFS transporter [Pseudomonadales bacterium]|tara:strand:+ start:24121 stop:25293 length:1173 start_codon:yes stop_codon:yes gene_type:complete